MTKQQQHRRTALIVCMILFNPSNTKIILYFIFLMQNSREKEKEKK